MSSVNRAARQLLFDWCPRPIIRPTLLGAPEMSARWSRPWAATRAADATVLGKSVCAEIQHSGQSTVGAADVVADRLLIEPAIQSRAPRTEGTISIFDKEDSVDTGADRTCKAIVSP
jgi:hypothetical protein